MALKDIRIENDKTEEVLKALQDAKKKIYEEWGLIGERYAKELCPVDTGRLRNSISHEYDEEGAYIGTNVEYAPYVELGTSRQSAQPYLEPAVTNHFDEYKEIAEKTLKNF